MCGAPAGCIDTSLGFRYKGIRPWLRAEGFPESDIFLGGAAPTKANLVVRYRGSGARKPILLLAHTDVVEAKREDWSRDPFKFEELDGYFYGRGTGDDKAQAAVWIANLIRFKQEASSPTAT